MTDPCPACGSADNFDEWAEVAHQADIAVTEIGRRMFEDRAASNLDPHDFIEALLAGLVTGAVAVGFTITKPDSRDAVMGYIRDYLDTARANYEDAEGEGSMVQ